MFDSSARASVAIRSEIKLIPMHMEEVGCARAVKFTTFIYGGKRAGKIKDSQFVIHSLR